jgi:YHS domain-containing protein
MSATSFGLPSVKAVGSRPIIAPYTPSIMKTLLSALALGFISASLAIAAPVNTTCIMSGKDVDPTITSTHNGKVVAFCCAKCKARFDSDPAKFGKKIK